MAEYETMDGQGNGSRSHCGRRRKRLIAYANLHGITVAQARERLRRPQQRPTVATPTTDVGAKLTAVLATELVKLNLTSWAYNPLDKANLRNIADLTARTEEELLDLRNFGQKGLNEVKAKLASLDPPIALKSEKVLAYPIEELDLSVQPYRLLKHAGIDTIGQLVATTEDALQGFGDDAMREIKRQLGRQTPPLALKNQMPIIN